MANQLVNSPGDFQVEMHRAFEQVANLASKESSAQFQCVLDLRELFNRYFQEVNILMTFAPIGPSDLNDDGYPRGE